MGSIALRNVSKRWGHTWGLRTMTLDLLSPQFVVLYGPRGSGKSVLCRLVVGVDHPTDGTILIDGVDVTRMAPIQRRIAYVPQTFALYPQFSVYDNIAYPLAIQGEKKPAIRNRVDRIVDTLGISDIVDKRPNQLSGGQKQRVAIAKGLVLNRKVYVLDDPLVGLDYKIRERLVDELRSLQESLDALFIYATSDTLEPLQLADHIMVLDHGEMVDQGTPPNLYYSPAHLRSTTLGYPAANMIPGRLLQDEGSWRVHTNLFDMPVEMRSEMNPEQEVVVAVRAEDILLQEEGTEGAWFDATVQLEEDIGSERIVHLLAQGEVLQAGILGSPASFVLGQTLGVRIVTAKLPIFSRDQERLMATGMAQRIEVKGNG